MQSRKQCALPIIATMALWQLMHLGTSWALTNRTPCAQLHMNYAHLASVRFEHAVCIYIYI